MTDPLDRAKELEQLQRDSALAKHKNRPQEKPHEQNGHRYCLDCGIEISPERLAANPNAVRDIDCQELHELQQKKQAR